jgi:hypothetical protein
MKVVTCTTRQRNDRSEKYCAVVQAIQGTQEALNRNLLLVDSYSEVVNGRIPVMWDGCRFIIVGCYAMFNNVSIT